MDVCRSELPSLASGVLVSETPWERANKSKSQQQEERTAKMKGGRKQPNSGRRWNAKGDATLESFLGKILIDNKTHDDPEKNSYRITKPDWLTLRRIARQQPPGCHPALQIDIQDIHLLVMELGLWDEAVEFILNLEEKVKRLEEREDERRQSDMEAEYRGRDA